MFLLPKFSLVVQTSAFEEMKNKLAPITAAAEKRKAGKPSLLITREQNCTCQEARIRTGTTQSKVSFLQLRKKLKVSNALYPLRHTIAGAVSETERIVFEHFDKGARVSSWRTNSCDSA